MTAPALSEKTVLCTVPFKVVRWVLTHGTTATAIAHGETGTPDVLFAVNSFANPTASEVSIYSPDATNITIDCEHDGTYTSYLYAIFFEPSSGGLSNVA
jgi:hypothetical protein